MSAPVPEIPAAESLTVEFKSDLARLNDDELVSYDQVMTRRQLVTQ